MTGALALLLVLPLAEAAPPRGPSPIASAEALAREALAMAPQDPAGALTRARKALALTSEFVPTAFVQAGRKGEVVEDAFQSAREAYRQHRALCYEAVGTALARQGQLLAASRYLRRAMLLDPQPRRGLALARAELALGKGREALATVQRAISGLVSLTPEAAAVMDQAADVAGVPSAQAEIDRGRLKATLGDKVTLREGPVTLPPGVKLSTVPVFHLEDAPVSLIYVSEPSCRYCSADLADLRRLVPQGVRVLTVPEARDQDVALRQVLSLYRYPWPVMLGGPVAEALGLHGRQALIVARGGWTALALTAPFGPSLGAALAALQRTDVRETVPRAKWNHRPVDRSPLPAPPGLLEEGLAPGEDEPFPPAFEAAVAAYRAGRYAEARKAFDDLAAAGDGWLLPPEGRLDRALCLARMGQRDEARRILLRTGDSRFEKDVDRVLEIVAGQR
jgi:tetratricopeptide (TPR) repeat protein